MRNILILILMAFFSGKPAVAEESEPEFLQLYRYKPIYFIMGNPYTKIQFSFKTQLIKDVPFYFGYTQLMFWDLFIPSPYFQDISYNPLAFYRYSLDPVQNQFVDLIPVEHESNGKGGADERSWNRVGAAYNRGFKVGDKSSLTLNFKAWVPIYYNPNNTDLAQYRGVWELTVDLSQFMGPYFDFDDVALRVYPGGQSLTNPLHGGQELTVRVKSVHRTFLPLLVGQVFHGYGESLIEYQEDRWGFRAGFGF